MPDGVEVARLSPVFQPDLDANRDRETGERTKAAMERISYAGPHLSHDTHPRCLRDVPTHARSAYGLRAGSTSGACVHPNPNRACRDNFPA